MPARNRADRAWFRPDVDTPEPQPAEGEPVDVLVRTEQDRELPDLVVADGQLWSVRKIIAQELARRPPAGELGEHVWWVVVAAGRSGREHVWALGQAYPSGRWRVRSVGDRGPVPVEWSGSSGRASR